MKSCTAAFVLTVIALLASCGGGGSYPSAATPIPALVSIAIAPPSAALLQGAAQAFSTTISGTSNAAVSWSVQEGAAGGSISASGQYTAPNAAGTFHVVAASQADPTKSASATVTVPDVTVGVSPTTAPLLQGATQSFSATVSGSVNTAVTWSVQEGAAGGVVNAAGQYTAPNVAGTFHIVATSQGNPAKSAVVSVTVSDVVVSIAPPTISLLEGGTQSFTATVTGSVNTAVTWSVQEGAAGGTIASTGQYTAPNVLGTFHVVATSQGNPAKSASVSVVTVPDATVSISVYSTATMLQGGSRRFTASVNGAANTGVTWSVLEGPAGGTISSTGLYTTPNRPGTFHVVATSQANPSRSASATVAVADVAVSTNFPSLNTFCLGGAIRLKVNVNGTVNTAVTWSVQEGATAATVTPDGVFRCTASSSTFHVIATSVQDTSKSVVIAVTPRAAPTTASNSVVISGTLPSVPQQAIVGPIYADVTTVGVADQRVTWNSGLITPGAEPDVLGHEGFSFTASLPPGTYNIVATSVADITKSGTWTVTVAPLTSIPILPTTDTLGPGLKRTFTAATVDTFGNPLPLAVTWSESGGSIDTNGVFTAPTVPGIYTVTASTSLPILTATSTVTVANSGYFGPGPNVVGDLGVDPITATLLPTGLVLLYGDEASQTGEVTSRIYDPASASLAVGPKGLPSENQSTFRSDHTATLLPNGKVLIAGGFGSLDCGFGGCIPSSSSTAGLYDPVSGVITPTGSMTAARAKHTATLLPNGRVLITGGLDESFSLGAGFLSSAEQYDPATGIFSAVGNMTASRSQHTATLLANGKVLIAGGACGLPIGACLRATSEFYDPATATFSAGPPMATDRVGAAATLLPDSTVLMVGGVAAGCCATPVRTTSAELYDPVSGTFVATGSMMTARAGPAAALLHNGKVLVTGGSGDRTAELYNPASHLFEPTGGTEHVFDFATLVVLPDGSVLLFGSTETPNAISGVTEIYFPQP